MKISNRARQEEIVAYLKDFSNATLKIVKTIEEETVPRNTDEWFWPTLHHEIINHFLSLLRGQPASS